MTKADTYNQLEQLVEGQSIDFLLRALFNYFDSATLEEFTEFVKTELEP